jgi:hypothetical protein
MSNLDKVQALFAAYARAQRRYRHTGRDGGRHHMENSRAPSSGRAEAWHQGGDGFF